MPNAPYARILVVLGAASLLATSTPAVARAAGPIPRLVAHWTFDASNGADASGNAHTLTIGGTATFAAARGGHAASLDGTGGWLERDSDPAFTPGTSSWSVCAWVNLAFDTTTAHVAVSWYRCGADPLCGSADGALYDISVSKLGSPTWQVRDDADTIRTLISAPPIMDGQWHFLVGVRDSVNHIVQLYVDGALSKSQSMPVTSITTGGFNIPLSVGRTAVVWGPPQSYLHGMIDDVQIFRGALTASDVIALQGNGVLAVELDAPTTVALAAPGPNPSRGGTTLRFALPAPGHVRLAVFDLAGRRVRTLMDGARPAGSQQVAWDGRDEAGQAARAGLYLYRLETLLAGSGAEVRTCRGVLVP